MTAPENKPIATVIWPDRLVAYVDGELQDHLVPEVEASIAADSMVRAIVEDLRQSRILLHAAFSDKAVLPRTESIAPRRRREPQAWKRAAAAAVAMAAAVMLIISVRVGPLSKLPGDEVTHLHDEVAAYHTVYMTEREHLVEVPASQQAHIEQWLGGRLHGPLHVPDLEVVGFQFAGARLLTLGTVPVAQLMYTAEGRLPIALCVAAAGGENRAPMADRHHGLGVASWVENGQTYVVVGDLNDAELSSIVETAGPAVKA